MLFRNKETGEIVNKEDIVRLHPATSFPVNLTLDILEDFGYEPVLNGPEIMPSSPYETVEIDGAVQINGKWYTNYVIGPLFKEYTDSDGVIHTKEEQYQKHCLTIYNGQAVPAREERKGLLRSCDWTQLQDSPLNNSKKQEWAQYRQSLRDLPAQEKFPWDIDWPEPPL